MIVESIEKYISYLIGYFHLLKKASLYFGAIIFSYITGFLYIKNKNLKEKNGSLKSKVKEQENSVSKKRKVINAIKKNKPTNIAGNVSRMRKRKM